MKIRQKPVVSVQPSPPPAVVETPKAATAKADDFDAQKRKELMDNTLRAEQGGPRPAPRMTAGPGMRAFTDAQERTLAPGVVAHTLLKEAADPACSIERVDVAAGHATPETRAQEDQRTLVEGKGTLVLNGVRQSVVPGDMVLMPRGTRYQFEADGGEPLKLWSVMSPPDAPMTRAAGVLSENPAKEFFVGEGVHILERANSASDPAVGFDRCRAPAGITTALHKLKIDERYLVTRGEGDMEIDGQVRHVKAGDVVVIPRGASQRITAGDGGVDFYSVSTPRFLVEDYAGHLQDATVDPKRYDGSAGDLADVLAKIHKQ